MSDRQRAWPKHWLMTDERIGDRLWAALGRLPTDSGVVFRHYRTRPTDRAEIGHRVAGICRKNGFALAIAADGGLARSLGADLIHNPAESPADLPFSMAVHSIDEAEKARIAGAALAFVSPVNPTRSHPQAEPLGDLLALEIARAAEVPAIALGGMDHAKFAGLRDGFHGWAAIDAWLD